MDSSSIKDIFYRLLSWIDNGRFFIKPMKWLYTLCAFLSFLVPVALFIYLVGFLYDFSKGYKYLGYENVHNSWVSSMIILFGLIYILIVTLAAYLNYLFWIHRRNQIDSIVKEGDQIVAIPLFAHQVQCAGEAMGVYLMFIPPIASVLYYSWALISGIIKYVVSNDNVLLAMLIGLIAVFIFVLICVIAGYSIVLASHFLAEKIKLVPQIANDVRDLGDIHRAATLTENTPLSDDTTGNSLY